MFLALTLVHLCTGHVTHASMVGTSRNLPGRAGAGWGPAAACPRLMLDDGSRTSMGRSLSGGAVIGIGIAGIGLGIGNGVAQEENCTLSLCGLGMALRCQWAPITRRSSKRPPTAEGVHRVCERACNIGQLKHHGLDGTRHCVVDSPMKAPPEGAKRKTPTRCWRWLVVVVLTAQNGLAVARDGQSGPDMVKSAWVNTLGVPMPCGWHVLGQSRPRRGPSAVRLAPLRAPLWSFVARAMEIGLLPTAAAQRGSPIL